MGQRAHVQLLQRPADGQGRRQPREPAAELPRHRLRLATGRSVIISADLNPKALNNSYDRMYLKSTFRLKSALNDSTARGTS